MKVSKEELEHLAKLSKIKLTEEEKVKYQENMEDIIGFLDQLKVDEKEDLGNQEKLSCFE
jgi:aspartyl/glutamyl-tRNA(Asn/Gln) amidotransferase C subunit